MREKIQQVIDERIKPILEMHGGGIEIDEIDEEEGMVKVKFSGMCAGCPVARETFNSLVVNELLKIPRLKSVEVIN